MVEQYYKTFKDIPSKEELYVGGSFTCQGCPGAMGIKLALKVLGKNTVVINAAGCMTLLCVIPHTPLKVGWVYDAIENAAPTAAAIKLMKPELNVLCYVGDGATYDIGFQSLSHAFEKKRPIIYICYNNQTYGNTGAQWSPATPYAAETRTTPRGKKLKTGNIWPRKEIEKILAAHKIYVATASIAFPLDYMNKIRRIKESNKPGFINLLVPCIPGWGINPWHSVKLSRLAVQTGFWPLYEITEDGVLHLNFKPKKLLALEEFLKYQQRYKGIPKKDLKKLKELIRKKWDELLKYDGKVYIP